MPFWVHFVLCVTHKWGNGKTAKPKLRTATCNGNKKCTKLGYMFNDRAHQNNDDDNDDENFDDDNDDDELWLWQHTSE